MMFLLALVLGLSGGMIAMPSAHAVETGGYPYANESTCAWGAQYCKPDPWRFYMRECTSFVAWKLNTANGFAFKNDFDGNGSLDFGHAKDWGYVAPKFGYQVNSTPAVGSVAWSADNTYGHVAWVKAVNGEYVTIEEYNKNSDGNYSTRTIHKGAMTGYIHFKDITTTPPPSLSSQRIVILQGSTLVAKDGVNDSWTQLAGNVSKFDVAGDRIAFTNSAGGMYLKTGLHGSWVKIADGVSSFKLTG